MQLRPLYSKIQLPGEPPDIIRLLKIEKIEGDRIICHLDQAKVSEAPEYSTLSYTWRSPLLKDDGSDPYPSKHVIHFIDGDSIPVFDNLYQAFLRLGRSDFRDQHFWIDAICIDQDNTVERNHQVDLMAQIYQHAKHVIVWLGPDDEHVDAASKLIETLPPVLETIPEKDWSKRINPWKIDEIDIPELRKANANQQQSWISLAHFFRRNWWSRSWVIQEVLLSQNLKLFCGTEREISWGDLERVSHFLSTTAWRQVLSDQGFLGIAPGECLPEYNTPTFLKAARRDLSADNDFLYTLIRARRHNCQMPIDKVFSLYGIASAYARDRTKVPKANYYLTPDVAFTQTARYILESSKDMHILAHVEGSKFQRLANLPSWVPDWTVTEPMGLGITGYKRYYAAGDPQLHYQKPQFPEPHILRLEATRVDRIAACSKPRGKDSFPDWMDLLQGLEKDYFNRQSCHEAFWRTLICDTDNHKACPSPPELEICFRAWLKKHDLSRRFQEVCQAEGIQLTINDTDGSSHDADRFDLCLSHRQCLRLFRTEEGYLGSGTECLQAGDSVWMVPGSRVPLILRERPSQGASNHLYELVGGTYLHGFMRPEPAVLPSGIVRKDGTSRMLKYEVVDIV
ncbi:hypothetical protein M409DRAFT_19065 [Zasmidium cellare ATCC 36951]|uniref:Heterokaryon incompatibility domain-containing protein n=1 Tax=Zasmidium cellare ATCC 36951 TaxID=1080233 RepID=A0A6A6CVC7_ZASCE|nr:uncharacterized protein M409DRAFT_19065 [Zasmidium cellare ATCC 36951]KAF2171094.1 hypothetical protein M409DRAFT_19065 [Zasmidium cellare ATCC 36951]